MEAMTALNGIVNQKLAENVEKYARLSGLRMCRIRDALYEGKIPEGRILYTDRQGAAVYHPVIKELSETDCPVIMIPASQSDVGLVRKYRKNITAHAGYPFSLREFRFITDKYLDDELLAQRNLDYGNLYIDKEQRKIIYRGGEVPLGPYEYVILLFMLDHIGVAVNRSDINEILPDRKRENTRNVDTHIKNIRRRLNMKEVILSVRSVGYRIDPDRLYQWSLQGE